MNRCKFSMRFPNKYYLFHLILTCRKCVHKTKTNSVENDVNDFRWNNLFHFAFNWIIFLLWTFWIEASTQCQQQPLDPIDDFGEEYRFVQMLCFTIFLSTFGKMTMTMAMTLKKKKKYPMCTIFFRCHSLWLKKTLRWNLSKFSLLFALFGWNAFERWEFRCFRIEFTALHI